MIWLVPLVTKILWWLLPKALAGAADYFEKALYFVEQADKEIEGPAARRAWALERLGGFGFIPETILRGFLEFVVILHGIGVTAKQLDAAEALVGELAKLETLTSAEKRGQALERLQEVFPSTPERIARFLVQIAWMKISGGKS